MLAVELASARGSRVGTSPAANSRNSYDIRRLRRSNIRVVPFNPVFYQLFDTNRILRAPNYLHWQENIRAGGTIGDERGRIESREYETC